MNESIGAEGVIVRLANRIAQLEVNLAIALSRIEDRPSAEGMSVDADELAQMTADDDGFAPGWGIEAVPDMPPKGEDK